MVTAHGVLVYDGDCGICQTASRWVQRNVDDVAVMSHVEHGVDVLEKVWFVTGNGRLEGAAAVSAVLKLANRLHYRLAGVLIGLPVLHVISRGVYWLVAKNRHRISRLFRLQACALPEK